jgi:hypothetical protein
MVIISDTVVEHLPHHPKIKGLSPIKAADIMRDKMTNNVGSWMANSSITVVEH